MKYNLFKFLLLIIALMILVYFDFYIFKIVVLRKIIIIPGRNLIFIELDDENDWK